jgi:riboflavin synthase
VVFTTGIFLTMFTGIVQGMGTVRAVQDHERLRIITVALGPLALGVQRGASVSIAGTCLTATEIDGDDVTFDVIGETLDRTTLGALLVGDRVNVERSAKVGDEMGGHAVSGHVTGTAVIRAVQTPSPHERVLTIGVDASWMPYLLPKGFVALDGCSLTIVHTGPDWFTVHVIPETIRNTTFGQKKEKDLVNLEIDPLTRAAVDAMRT